jgi:hypothetical protein
MRRQPVVAMIFLAVAASATPLWAANSGTKTKPASIAQGDVIPKQWLDQEVSIEQAEAKNMVEGIPFGASSAEWKRLRDSLQGGDSLWTYCSPIESFKALAGRCDIAIVRDGRVVMQLVTIMN